MRGTALIQFLLLSFALLAEGQNNRTISDVYANLPATCAECRKVKYELTAYNGCYTWLTLNPQIISLEQIPDTPECYSKALLTAVVSRPIKTVVIIKATDSVTKEALVSQVKVSRLAEIRILTNFKAIDVDDVQKLYIQAFDDSNNVISSVEGLRFEWKIETNQHALKVISSKEANYENTPARLEMESKRYQTDLILVRGVQTGVVEVTARILEKDYEGVKKARISLFVIEPFFLIPDKPVYLLPNSDFVYKIAKGKRQVKGRPGAKYNEVKLPNPQYHFVASDEKMLTVADSGLVHTKSLLGEVLVQVKDTTLVNNTVEGLINVVEPEILELNIRDVTSLVAAGTPLDTILSQADLCENFVEDQSLNNWNLVVNHAYVVTSCLLDGSKNTISLTSNIEFEVAFSEEHMQYLGSTPQQSILLFKAVAPAVKGIKLKSTLSVRKDPRYRAFADKELRIFPQVKISHPYPTVLLPYLARTRTKKLGQQEPQMWTLEAVGGSGAYKWDSENAEIAPITAQGTVFGLKLGSAKVMAYDALNPWNNDTIEVEVSRVAKLVWMEEKMELPSDSKEIVSAIALDSRGRKFTNCTEVPLSWTIKDETIAKIRNGEQGPSSYEALKAYVHGPGKELIKLRHSYDQAESGKATPATFNEWEQLHNAFGICGQRTINTLNEGMARITTTFSIVEEDGISYKRDSDYAFVLAYKPLQTLNPSYEEFLKNLKTDEKDESYRKYLQQLKTENEYILGYGSGLLWEVAGGTSNWIDLPGHYTENIKVEKSAGVENLHLSLQTVNGGAIKSMKPQHYLECPVPDQDFFSSPKDNEFKLTLATGNKRAKSLLRPAVNVLTITVSCQLPQSMQLVWAQKDPSRYEKFPKKESEGEPDTYFIRTEQVVNTRMLVFDKYRRVFYNFSSYGRKEATTDERLGIIKELQPYYMHELETTQKTGTFLVEGSLLGVYEPNNNRRILDLSKINDKMRINSVNMLKVEPEYKLLYLHEKNKLVINFLQGSGSFSVKSNVTGIVDIKYNAKTSPRSAIITPLKEGYVSITVEDVGVANSVTSACVILVSDVDRISLKQDLLLEHGTSSRIQVTHYGLNGEAFSLDQYKYIGTHLYQERKRIPSGHASYDSSIKGLVITTEGESSPDSYSLLAKDVGGYEVSASVSRRSKSDVRGEVYSNPIYIEVFPYLQVYPRKLLLLPDGSYTLKISGGPSSVSMDSDKTALRFGNNIARVFQSSDTDIATVDSTTGEVKGKRVGDTTIYVVITQGTSTSNGLRYEELCRRAVPVSVKLATGVEIEGAHKRPILAGAIIRLLAVLKHRNETFTYGVYPVEYWWTSKQFHVFGLQQNLLAKQGESAYASSVQGDQLGVNGKAHRVGEAEISVHVSINYPEEYKGEPNEFNLNTVLRVVNPLYGNVPTFVDSPPVHTSTYLLPPRCTHRFPPNKENNMKLTYHQLCTSTSRQHPVLSLSEENLVKTSDHYGSATIVVEESSLVDPLRSAYYVEVAPIHSAVIEKGIDIIAMPLGADVVLKVVYQDKFGRSFADAVEGIDAQIDISHPRVLRADLDYYNGTLTVRALSLGTSNIHIFMPGRERTFDLVKVHVTSIIEPVSPVFVHIGGTVQFKTSHNYSGLGKAVWGSEDPSILEVNSVTGLGKARNEGITNVHINDTIHLTTSVTCGKVKYISLDLASSPKILTNIESHKQYKSHYKLQFRIYPDDPNIDITPDFTRQSSSLINHNVHFECKSLNPNWVVAKPEEDVTKGQMKGAVCFVYPRVGTISENAPSTITIEVSAGSKEAGYMKSEKFAFPFVSAFHILGSKDLVFSKTNRTKTVKVSGSTDLKVWAEDPTQCDIRVGQAETENLSEISVSIPRDITYSFKNMLLHIENPLTGQKEDITVSYYNEVFDTEHAPEVTAPTGGWNVTDILTVLILVITVIIVVKYIIWPANGVEVRPQRPFGPVPVYRTPVAPGLGPRGFGTGATLSKLWLQKMNRNADRQTGKDANGLYRCDEERGLQEQCLQAIKTSNYIQQTSIISFQTCYMMVINI
eukprot:TRINITY_DN932_c0_g1_i1.p1 TRINITY_DN932_c0_g1~~TRINITY_DN932_c0_g1_i1.p1  ORF type:complete len:2036 (-),score=158.71 TRINITY_DN932_c0_g1_i1:14-6121(-)